MPMKLAGASIRIFLICTFTWVILHFVEPPLDLSQLQEIHITAIKIIPQIKKLETPFDCLRRNIYFEAANQGEEGMIAVANVTMNRLADDDYPDTICGVVYQASVKNGKKVCQFSWYCDHKSHLVHAADKTWKLAGTIAKKALHGNLDNEIGEATLFHAIYVYPTWASEKEFVIAVGDHLFYK